MRYLTLKEFNKRVTEILSLEAMIGSTVQDEIRWKVNEIMKLTRIPVDISDKQKDNSNHAKGCPALKGEPVCTCEKLRRYS